MRSARRPPSSLERFLVFALVGFIAIDLLLIVPAYASELRLDRLHPSLPIVNLRPLAAGRARIADGLGEEFMAPVQKIVGELQRAGAKALNAVLNEGGTATGDPFDHAGPKSNPNIEGNSDSDIAQMSYATPSPSPDNTSTGDNSDPPAPTVDSLETSVVETATALALPPSTQIPAATLTQIASYTPGASSTQSQPDPSMTPSQIAVLTATVLHTASPTPTWQSTVDPTFTLTVIASSTPTSPAAAPTSTPTATPTLPQEGAQTYYVATNGNDSNPGTASEPFRTINQGVSVLGPGDTLFVKSGTYAESLYDVIPSGTSWAKPVTLAAYPGDVVTIKPSSGNKVIRFTRSQYIIIDGFVLDGANVATNVIKITKEAHHIRIQNSELRGAPSQGILVTNYGSINSDYNEFINLDVHNNGTTNLDHGLYITTRNNLIDRSSIHHNAGYGVHIYMGGCNNCANNNIVSNNAIYDNASAGSWGPGIILSSGSGNLAYNNLIWGNAGGIQVAYRVSDAQVYNNVVYANDNYGIRIQSDSVNAIIRNNIVYQNGSETISDAGSGTIQDHNLVETDPQFVDAPAHDFHLQPTSPAIDTGTALSEVPYDFDGISRPRGAGFDIGAYESPFSRQ